MTRHCPNCGAAANAGDRFCGACGATLRQAESRKPPSASALRQDRDSPHSPKPGSAPSLIAVLLASTLGAVVSFLGVFGLYLFQSGGRIFFSAIVALLGVTVGVYSAAGLAALLLDKTGAHSRFLLLYYVGIAFVSVVQVIWYHNEIVVPFGALIVVQVIVVVTLVVALKLSGRSAR